jgi:hypothetical protein
MNRRQAMDALDRLLAQPNAAQVLGDALIADFDAQEARRVAHVARIDALEKPSTPRWCLSRAATTGRAWLLSVTWMDGPGWKVSSTKWTFQQKKAGCFLPECALAVAQQMVQMVEPRFERP